MKKSLLSIITIATISFASTAQIVNIPDANFKAYLVGNNSINTNMDSEIQVTEANSFTGAVLCSSLNISDLTGIEEFTSITNLTCDMNNLTSLILPINASMTNLVCNNNAITSLDLSVTPNLYNATLSSNGLISLDVTGCTAVAYLNCGANNLTSLDFTTNTSLEYLYVFQNELTSLNLANGNNTIIAGFISTTNPNLTCIQVDDVAWSTSNWTNIDPASSFSLDCSIYVSSITVMGQAGATLITTNGGTLQMVADVLPANADDMTYTWSVTNGTGSASIDASGLLTAITNGTVTVIATANDGSGITGSTDITISNQTSAGINDQAALSNLSIYPNPAKTSFTIDAEEEVKSIVFINLMGETVKTIIAPTNTVDLSDLATGIYMLQIQFENAVVNQRLIKE